MESSEINSKKNHIEQLAALLNKYQMCPSSYSLQASYKLTFTQGKIEFKRI